jgi:hydroxyquinol 1,2-dioxygenase
MYFRLRGENQRRFIRVAAPRRPPPLKIMLRAMGRHPDRPGHIHMMVYGDGHVPLTTHLFAADSPYLDSDAVFGVRDSLIVPFEKHAPGKAPDGCVMDKPFHSAQYDFALAPAS